MIDARVLFMYHPKRNAVLPFLRARTLSGLTGVWSKLGASNKRCLPQQALRHPLRAQGNVDLATTGAAEREGKDLPKRQRILKRHSRVGRQQNAWWYRARSRVSIAYLLSNDWQVPRNSKDWMTTSSVWQMFHLMDVVGTPPTSKKKLEKTAAVSLPTTLMITSFTTLRSKPTKRINVALDKSFTLTVKV